MSRGLLRHAVPRAYGGASATVEARSLVAAREGVAYGSGLADALLLRVSSPPAEDLLLRVHLALDRGDWKAASALAQGLPAPARQATDLKVLLAWDLACGKQKEEARANLAGIIADESAMKGADPLMLLDAICASGMVDEVTAGVRRVLAAAPYNAFMILRAEQILKDRGGPEDLRHRLELALTVVDPRNVLRRIPPGKRVVYDW